MRKGLKSREVDRNLPPVARFAYYPVFEDVEVRIVARGAEGGARLGAHRGVPR